MARWNGCPANRWRCRTTCWPEALIGDLPVIYPFIVNDPGEAAQAKRRIGAVTLGHLPPPLAATSLPAELHAARAAAGRIFHRRRPRPGAPRPPDRRDPRRGASRRGRGRSRACRRRQRRPKRSPRIDRFVCDIKESQFGDGLHIFGRGACGRRSATALLAALGGPARRRRARRARPIAAARDVLPTGRNLFAVDPRAVPTRARPCARRQAGRGTAAPPSAGSRRLAAAGWWSISGARPPCARRARNSPWRCIWPASRRAGTTARTA